MSRRKRLAQQRALLLAECALQRTTLVAQSRQLGLSTGLIKSDEGFLGRFKQIPGWAGLLTGAIMLFVPGRLATLARTGLILLQLLQMRKNPPSDSASSTPGR